MSTFAHSQECLNDFLMAIHCRQMQGRPLAFGFGGDGPERCTFGKEQLSDLLMALLGCEVQWRKIILVSGPDLRWIALPQLPNCFDVAIERRIMDGHPPTAGTGRCGHRKP